MIKIEYYDGSEEERLRLQNWMNESALEDPRVKPYHVLSRDGRLVIHPGDSVYRTEANGFGVICHHVKYAAYPYNVDWRSRP